MNDAEKRVFSKCATVLVELVLETDGQDRVYSDFCALDPRLRKVPKDAFCRDYVAAKLALGCIYWAGCCANRRIENKELTNLYFKEVMGLFGSPRSLEDAKRFSESLYAANSGAEQSPVLGILSHLFRRFKIDPVQRAGKAHEESIHVGYQFMMQVSEALKVAFETRFDEMLDSCEGLTKPEMERKR